MIALMICISLLMQSNECSGRFSRYPSWGQYPHYPHLHRPVYRPYIFHPSFYPAPKPPVCEIKPTPVPEPEPKPEPVPVPVKPTVCEIKPTPQSEHAAPMVESCLSGYVVNATKKGCVRKYETFTCRMACHLPKRMFGSCNCRLPKNCNISKCRTMYYIHNKESKNCECRRYRNSKYLGFRDRIKRHLYKKHL